MHNFIDLHCHTLHGVDDGAESIDTSKEMLKIAYEDGIKTICFTPHFKMHHFINDEEILAYNKKINNSFSELCEYASEEFPDMHLILGSEVFFHSDICESLSTKKCKLIGETKYVLVEFKPETNAFDIKTTLLKLLRKGYLPILAHIERYYALYKDVEFLEEMRRSGVVIQVNSHSMEIKFGKTARFIKRLLKKSLVNVVCSDAHDSKAITPKLSNAYSLVKKKYGSDYANDIFFTNPQRILQNERLL